MHLNTLPFALHWVAAPWDSSAVGVFPFTFTAQPVMTASASPELAAPFPLVLLTETINKL